MKKDIVLFERGTYQNESTNAKRTYASADSLRKVLGQAKTIRVQPVGFRMSTGTELKLYMYETPYDGIRPNDLIPGGAAFFTSVTISTLRPAVISITGPFSGNVTIVLEVKHTTDSAQVEWDGIVAATLIMEE